MTTLPLLLDFENSQMLLRADIRFADPKTQKRKKTEREALKTSKQQTFSIPHCSALVP
jgi:hypothetical protein